MTRFERATPSSQARCATKLRHIPKVFANGNSLSCSYLLIFICQSCRGALPTSHKTILNRFVRQSATSRKLFLKKKFYKKTLSFGYSCDLFSHLLCYNTGTVCMTLRFLQKKFTKSLSLKFRFEFILLSMSVVRRRRTSLL